MISPACRVVCYSSYSSPIGELLLAFDGDAVTGISMAEHRGKPAQGPDPSWRRDDTALRAVREQLALYFEGSLQEFNLPLRMPGTPFQQKVWEGLRAIPYGETISYAELARRVGHFGASRAVGSANGRNPIPIIVPCHRVIAADGTLGGFGGGLSRKQWLLEHERAVSARRHASHVRRRQVATAAVAD